MAAILGIILIVSSNPVTAYVTACWILDDLRIRSGKPPRFSHAAWLFPLALAVAGIALLLFS